MREKELEQVLQEALSACIDDGRSMDEVLLEHVAYRGRLEPLLATALETYETLQRENPDPVTVDEALARFLEAARTRRDVRYLKNDDKY